MPEPAFAVYRTPNSLFKPWRFLLTEKPLLPSCEACPVRNNTGRRPGFGNSIRSTPVMRSALPGIASHFPEREPHGSVTGGDADDVLPRSKIRDAHFNRCSTAENFTRQFPKHSSRKVIDFHPDLSAPV
jgi:hypothetical protein